jgi:hypothetical protein
MIRYSKLHLAFQVEYSDTDIFIALKKLDDEENEIIFIYFIVYEYSLITQEYLHASHYAIDKAKLKSY